MKLPPLTPPPVGAITSGEAAMLRAWADDHARAAVEHAAQYQLYDGQTIWNACARAGEVEREKLRARLMEMHERDNGRHNYWHCAVVELFGA